ncbi:MAG: protein kinase [Lachnospiraceae bacterium]|nr:protein kinase [Lachnospiraceae bacterium]
MEEKNLNYCPHCTRKITPGSGNCPYCGGDPNVENEASALSVGTMLNRRYYIGKALRKGGFGITYVGCDTRLNKKIAVKEYFPSAVASRDSSGTQYVTLTGEKSEELFEKEKKKFVTEAYTLAEFANEHSIVSVTDILEENDTVYLVMEFIEGDDLDRYIKKSGKMSFKKAFEMMGPIILSLRSVHKRGLIHRDITPANVKIQPDNTAILLDFGAAREFEGSENTELSVILKPGYAPPEQYQSKGEQGPWTDVYGICATMYKMITGKTPVNSIDRMLNDILKKPSELGCEITPQEEAALFHGLAVAKAARIASMQALYDEMLAATQGKAAPPAADDEEEEELTVLLTPEMETSGQFGAAQTGSTGTAASGAAGAGSHAAGGYGAAQAGAVAGASGTAGAEKAGTQRAGAAGYGAQGTGASQSGFDVPGSGTSRREPSADTEKKKGSIAPIIGVIAGIVIVGAVAGFLLFGKSDKEDTTAADSAQSTASGDTGASDSADVSDGAHAAADKNDSASDKKADDGEADKKKESAAASASYELWCSSVFVMEDDSILFRILDGDAPYDGDITWESSDESVATVSDGVVTGESSGEATISATVGDKLYEQTVTVAKLSASGYALAANPQSLTVDPAADGGTSENEIEVLIKSKSSEDQFYTMDYYSSPELAENTVLEWKETVDGGAILTVTSESDAKGYIVIYLMDGEDNANILAVTRVKVNP